MIESVVLLLVNVSGVRNIFDIENWSGLHFILVKRIGVRMRIIFDIENRTVYILNKIEYFFEQN